MAQVESPYKTCAREQSNLQKALKLQGHLHLQILIEGKNWRKGTIGGAVPTTTVGWSRITPSSRSWFYFATWSNNFCGWSTNE